jgi:DNA-binding transcriptional regulator PaaX
VKAEVVGARRRLSMCRGGGGGWRSRRGRRGRAEERLRARRRRGVKAAGKALRPVAGEARWRMVVENEMRRKKRTRLGLRAGFFFRAVTGNVRQAPIAIQRLRVRRSQHVVASEGFKSFCFQNIEQHLKPIKQLETDQTVSVPITMTNSIPHLTWPVA